MFSPYHLFWLFVSIAVIVVSLMILKKHKVPLRKFLIFSLYAGVFVELIKIFSLIQLLPTSDGSTFLPYIETQHIPFHVCGLQKYLIATVVFTKSEKIRNNLLAFIYPTGLVGAFIALVIPSGASVEWSWKGVLLDPQAYQFFLYHALLVIIGAYIALSGEVEIRRKHYLTSAGILGGLGVVAVYLNSAFANAVYVNGKPAIVEYTPNYLFTYKPPIDTIKLTQVWHWYAYIAVLCALAGLVMLIFYEPIIRRNNKKTTS